MTQEREHTRISLFDAYDLDYGTSAPKLEPQDDSYYTYDEPQRQKKKRAKKSDKRKSAATLRRETLASAKSCAMALMLIAVVFSLVSAVIYLNVSLDRTALDIIDVEEEIKICSSESVRLNTELEGMVSIDKINSYATDVLGMVKLENYKITYFQNDNASSVVVSGGKSYE